MEKHSLQAFRSKSLPSEHAIRAGWDVNADRPVVSIVCTTYNHEKFIADAIRGFLLQKTSFPFEIIIHDDASTDATAAIVKSYAESYPALIKSVFQRENQYSQGVAMLLHATGYSRGEFVAFCEGDDYWVAEDKLQTQVEALQKHPECEICFHSAIKTEKEIAFDLPYCRRMQADGILPVNPIIRCGGAFMPTASIMIRKTFFERIAQDGSGFYKQYMDAYFFQIFCALAGGAYYIDRPMSVYRSFAEGSWTEKILIDQAFYIRWLNNHLLRMQAANRQTGLQYDADFQHAIKRAYLSFLNNINIDIECRQQFYQAHKSELSLLGKLLWHFVFRFRPIHAAFINLRAFVNNRLKQGLI